MLFQPPSIRPGVDHRLNQTPFLSSLTGLVSDSCAGNPAMNRWAIFNGSHRDWKCHPLALAGFVALISKHLRQLVRSRNRRLDRCQPDHRIGCFHRVHAHCAIGFGINLLLRRRVGKMDLIRKIVANRAPRQLKSGALPRPNSAGGRDFAEWR